MREVRICNTADISHEELLIFYKQIIEDIRFTKTQIWNTTYLATLAISGVIGLTLFINAADNIELNSLRLILIVSLYFIGILGTKALIYYQLTLNRYRRAVIKYKRKLKSKYYEYVDDELSCSRCFFYWFHSIFILAAAIFGHIIINTFN